MLGVHPECDSRSRPHLSSTCFPAQFHTGVAVDAFSLASHCHIHPPIVLTQNRNPTVGGGVGEADTGGALTLTCQTASFGAQHAADSGVHEDARGSVHHGALM
jgi:hypothetical protein